MKSADSNDNYILNEKGEPVAEPNLFAWAKWMEKRERHVADEVINGIRISTVFLGLNHNYGEGAPILWETMLFCDGELDNEMDRCSGSREQAEAMHARNVGKDIRRSHETNRP